MLCRLSALLCALAHYKSHSEEECHYQLVVSRRNAYLSRRNKARLINDRAEDDLCRILIIRTWRKSERPIISEASPITTMPMPMLWLTLPVTDV